MLGTEGIAGGGGSGDRAAVRGDVFDKNARRISAIPGAVSAANLRAGLGDSIGGATTGTARSRNRERHSAGRSSSPRTLPALKIRQPLFQQGQHGNAAVKLHSANFPTEKPPGTMHLDHASHKLFARLSHAKYRTGAALSRTIREIARARGKWHGKSLHCCRPYKLDRRRNRPQARLFKTPIKFQNRARS